MLQLLSLGAMKISEVYMLIIKIPTISFFKSAPISENTDLKRVFLFLKMAKAESGISDFFSTSKGISLLLTCATSY